MPHKGPFFVVLIYNHPVLESSAPVVGWQKGGNNKSSCNPPDIDISLNRYCLFVNICRFVNLGAYPGMQILSNKASIFGYFLNAPEQVSADKGTCLLFFTTPPEVPGNVFLWRARLIFTNSEWLFCFSNTVSHQIDALRDSPFLM
ncbi:hypothetical protein TNIN_147241 [Trichonephila inaurata madagascariensis]|uniref:Uncharacterized protein n=1 Tax=Trichonephila inaurata madagascariensis TaxID=2747483 RepID=A0A8X6YUT6_9ARAC|nr:hypothetical protein TNIN_147241 [Trichonephila inaurata madagascariensis]